MVIEIRRWASTLAGLLKRPFARDVGLLLGAEGIALLLLAVQGVLVARWLGPSGYGVVALIMAYPFVIRLVFDARTSEATIRYLGEFHARHARDKASAIVVAGYLIDAATSILAFAVVAGTAWWADGHLVHDEGSAGLLMVFAAALVLASPSATSKSVLRTLGAFSTMAIARVAVAAVGAGLVLSLVGAGLGIEGAVWGSAATQALDGIVLLTLGVRRARGTWGPASPRAAWAALEGRRRELAGFLAWTNLGSLLGLIPRQLGVILVGAIGGAAEAGYFRLAQSLTAFSGIGFFTLQSVAYPRLAALGGTGDRPKLFATARRYALLVGAPLGVLVALSIPLVGPIIRLLAGSAYNDAIVTTQFMLGAAAVAVGFFWLRPLYLTLGEVKLLAQIPGVTAVLTLLGFVVLIPPFGAVGAAFALLLMGIANPSALLALRRHHAVRLLRRHPVTAE